MLHRAGPAHLVRPKPRPRLGPVLSAAKTRSHQCADRRSCPADLSLSESMRASKWRSSALPSEEDVMDRTRWNHGVTMPQNNDEFHGSSRRRLV